MNYVKSAMLLAALTALVLFLGQMIAGQSGLSHVEYDRDRVIENCLPHRSREIGKESAH